MFHPESRTCEPLGASMPEFTPYVVLMLVPPSDQDSPQEGRISPPSGQACAPTRTGNHPHRVRSVLNPAAKRITYIWRILESLESWNLPPLTRRAWFDILIFYGRNCTGSNCHSGQSHGTESSCQMLGSDRSNGLRPLHGTSGGAATGIA